MTNITTEKALRELYGFPKQRTVDKQLAALEKHSIHFVAHSPFVLISTVGQSGSLDCSPRGGGPGFVKVLDEQTLLIPDAKGNKRLDSLVNIVETGRIGCLFLIPGIDETLRINGKAALTVAPELLSLFAQERNPPKTCIKVDVQEVFLHCAKAFMRSKLWHPESHVDSVSFPTMREMLNDQLGLSQPDESREEMAKRYEPDL